MKKKDKKKISTEDEKAILSVGQEVIRKESSALKALAEKLDNNFIEAVKLIYCCRGKVVVSGMGKAGIIGNKISATLSSLGHSSFFMHPAEAAHGDLGTLAATDVIILLSNSGNSEEIVKIIPAIKSIGCGIIGITANEESVLAKACKITILLGDAEEVDHLKLAPTTSTTSMLAIGDALAIGALRQNTTWQKSDFAFFHPGGALGKKLLRVANVMRKDNEIVLMNAASLVKDAIVMMSKALVGAAIIVNKQGNVKGIFADGDLRRHLETNPNVLIEMLSNVMTPNPKTIQHDAYALEALKMMKTNMIGELPAVNENNICVGVVSLKDLIAIGIY